MCFFDYWVNRREVDVTLFKVQGKDLQESFSFSGEVEKIGNINYISGFVMEPLEIKEGAQADIYIDEKYYEGYLQSLKKTNNSVFEAYVSVISDEEIKGNGEVTVYGDVDKNIVLVPKDCIFIDENGKESIMVATEGYCVKRNVEVGKITLKNKKQISKGIFCEELVVLNPKGIKTGDKIKEN